jgi:hypothetical protein
MMTLPATHNETSFAVAVGDATALILDAFAAVGDHRRTALTHAQNRTYAAIQMAHTPEEMILGNALNQAIKDLERKGYDR